MTKLGNMVWSEKSKDNEKSSLQEVKKAVMNAEETTELHDIVTREPKTVKIGVIEEPNEGRNAKEPVED